MDELAACRALSDRELVEELEGAAVKDRQDEARLLALVGEVDERGLALGLGYPSIFHYCVQRLKFAESTAYWRIQAARAARGSPIILDYIRSGELNTTTAKLIEPYLGGDEAARIIDEARNKSRKELEAFLASLSPSASRRDVVTRQGPMIVAKSQWPPAPEGGLMPGAVPPSGGGELQKALDIVEALDAERRRLHFDVGPDTAELLERARQILRHKYPFASLEDIVREALNVLLDHKDFERHLENGRPRPAGPAAAEGPAGESSRTIPMWVRREVWKRDGGRCAYVGEDGVCCDERSWLEFDHVVPFAKGGRSDDPGNIRLLCRAHNQLEARRAFGPAGRA